MIRGECIAGVRFGRWNNEMLFYLSQYLQEKAADTAWADKLGSLRLFHYITFRSAGAAITALLLSWWLGPRIIAWLKELKFGQQYADKAEETGGMTARVLNKRGTPTMGGILIVLAMDLSALLWTQLNELVVLTLLSASRTRSTSSCGRSRWRSSRPIWARSRT